MNLFNVTPVVSQTSSNIGGLVLCNRFVVGENDDNDEKRPSEMAVLLGSAFEGKATTNILPKNREHDNVINKVAGNFIVHGQCFESFR